MPAFVLCLLQSKEEILAFKVLTLATTLWKFSYNVCYLIKNLSGENEFVVLIRFCCSHCYLTMLNSFAVADDGRSFGRARWTFWFVYSESEIIQIKLETQMLSPRSQVFMRDVGSSSSLLHSQPMRWLRLSDG